MRGLVGEDVKWDSFVIDGGIATLLFINRHKVHMALFGRRGKVQTISG